MQVLFRCDASARMGVGHLMRCLTLASALVTKGANVTFVSQQLASGGLERIKAKGFRAKLFSDTSPDCFDEREDAVKTAEVLSEMGHVDWLIVDHYQIGEAWENVQRRYACNIMAIDDLANRRHNCRLLLDQNLFADASLPRYQGLVPDDCISLLGPAYALLREEFGVARAKYFVRERLKRLFVFFGGGDYTNETAKVIEALMSEELCDLEADVVIGGANPHYEEITRLCAARKKTVLYRDVDIMAELMAAADFCIGAGGSSVWERCCVGLPSIVVTVADNQIQPMQQLADAGAIVLYSGEKTVVGYRDILKDFSTGKYDWRLMSQTGRRLFDGNGAVRVAERMTGVSE